MLEVSRLGTQTTITSAFKQIAPPYKQFVDFVLFVVLCVCVLWGQGGGQGDAGTKSM